MKMHKVVAAAYLSLLFVAFWVAVAATNGIAKTLGALLIIGLSVGIVVALVVLLGE